MHVVVGQGRVRVLLDGLVVVGDRLGVLGRGMEDVPDVDLGLLQIGVDLEDFLVLREGLREVASALEQSGQQEAVHRILGIGLDQALQLENPVRVVLATRGGQGASHQRVGGHAVDRHRHAVARDQEKTGQQQTDGGDPLGALHEAEHDHDPVQGDPARAEPQDQRQQQQAPTDRFRPVRLVHPAQQLPDLVSKRDLVPRQHQRGEHQHGSGQTNDQHQRDLAEQAQVPKPANERGLDRRSQCAGGSERALARLPVHRDTGQTDLRASRIEGLGEVQRGQGLLVVTLIDEAIGFGDQGACQVFQASNPLRGAEGADPFRLTFRVLFAPVRQKRLALEPQRFEPGLEGPVVESAATTIEATFAARRVRLPGSALRTGPQADHARLRLCGNLVSREQ